MTRVEVTNVQKGFGKTQVLRGVSLDVPAGHFAVLVGPSGCGKSTLLRLLAGLDEPDQGTIRFGERDVTRLAPRERDVAMVFQSYALYPHMTVRDNLAFGLVLRKLAASEIGARVAEAAGMLGLESLLDRLPKQLSGGQRQRVAMGRAIVRRAPLCLFDEPLSNLDAALRAQVRVDIRRLHERLGMTSVYVTHDQVEAMTLADVIFVLNVGRVEQSGPPLEVFERPRTRFVAGFLGSPAMNFVEGSIEDGAAVAAGGSIRIPLPEGAFAGASSGQEITLGVRPQDLVPTADGPLASEVTVVEALGTETIVHAKVGEVTLVVRLPAEERTQKGATLRLAPARFHLFDRASGLSLDARPGDRGSDP